MGILFQNHSHLHPNCKVGWVLRLQDIVERSSARQVIEKYPECWVATEGGGARHRNGCLSGCCTQGSVNHIEIFDHFAGSLQSPDIIISTPSKPLAGVRSLGERSGKMVRIEIQKCQKILKVLLTLSM